MNNLERRTYPLEVRVSGEGEERKVGGHAAVFNQWSEDLGGFKEIVRKGAFKKTIKEADVRALFNHDENFVLGRNKAKTLTLSEDERGLSFEAVPPDTTWAADLMVSMDRGDIDQCSFGFRTIKDKWGSEDGMQTRELLEVRLSDVSVVTYPAYPQTDAQVRNLFGDTGIDFVILSSILFRSGRGAELRPEDIEMVRAAIDHLAHCIPSEPPEHSETGEADLQGKITIMRRRLELAEMTL